MKKILSILILITNISFSQDWKHYYATGLISYATASVIQKKLDNPFIYVTSAILFGTMVDYSYERFIDNEPILLTSKNGVALEGAIHFSIIFRCVIDFKNNHNTKQHVETIRP